MTRGTTLRVAGQEGLAGGGSAAVRRGRAPTHSRTVSPSLRVTFAGPFLPNTVRGTGSHESGWLWGRFGQVPRSIAMLEWSSGTRIPAYQSPPAYVSHLAGRSCQIPSGRLSGGNASGRVGAGTAACRGCDLDGERDRVAEPVRVGQVAIGEGGPAPAGLDPAGEERATECVTGADGVDDLDGRDGDFEAAASGLDADGVCAAGQDDDGRAVLEQPARGINRGDPRAQVGEIVLADLDDVAPGNDRVDPSDVGRSARA